MADIHKYRFIMTGNSYYDGYDRIFGKKNEKQKDKKGKSYKKDRRPRKGNSKNNAGTV